MRRAWLWGLLAALLLIPCLACSGWSLWATRPLPWRAAAAQPAPVLAWHGTLSSDQATAWLVARLLETYEYARQVDLVVGQGPADLLPRWPEEAAVLGHAVVEAPYGPTTVVWGELPAQDDALAALQAHLADAGWREPRWAYALYRLQDEFDAAGFAPPTQGQGPRLRILCGPQGRWASLQWSQVEDARLLVRLEIQEPDPADFLPPCDLGRVARWLARAPLDLPGPWSTVPRAPTLEPPTGVGLLVAFFQPEERHRFFGHAWLHGPADALQPRALLDAYATQLQAQDWRPRARQQAPDTARGQWTRRPWLGPRWHLDLAVVHDLPDQATAWLVMYRADALPRPARSLFPQTAPRLEVHTPAALTPDLAQRLVRALWVADGPPPTRLDLYAGPAAPKPPAPWPDPVAHLGMYAHPAPWTGGEERVWLGHTTQDTEALAADWDARLRAAGWQPDASAAPEPPSEGLIGPNLPFARPSGPEVVYCHPMDGQRVRLRLRPVPGQGTWVWLHQGPAAGLPCTPPRPQPRGPRALPALRLPPEVPRQPAGGWADPNGTVAEILWARASDPAALRAHLDDQLPAQGWQPLRRGAGLGLAWSVWAQDDRLLRLYLGRLEDAWTWIALVVGPAP